MSSDSLLVDVSVIAVVFVGWTRCGRGEMKRSHNFENEGFSCYFAVVNEHIERST